MKLQNLKNHVKVVHEGLKEFRCEFCKKEFGYRSHMKDHIVRLHRNEIPLDKQKEFSVRSYPCNICDKIYTNGQHLTRHKGTVHNERSSLQSKYKCIICEKFHFEKRDLELHLVNFHGLSNIFESSTSLKKCDICDQTFIHQRWYKEHISKTHDTECSECYKFFVSKSHVTHHMKKVHQR